MTFKELLSESNIKKAYDALSSALEQGNKKFNKDFWKYLESELKDEDIKLGNINPDDAFEELDDEQIIRAYKIFSKKYKDLF